MFASKDALVVVTSCGKVLLVDVVVSIWLEDRCSAMFGNTGFPLSPPELVLVGNFASCGGRDWGGGLMLTEDVALTMRWLVP